MKIERVRVNLIAHVVNLIKPDNGNDHRAGTEIYTSISTRKSGFACIVLLLGRLVTDWRQELRVRHLRTPFPQVTIVRRHVAEIKSAPLRVRAESKQILLEPKRALDECPMWGAHFNVSLRVRALRAISCMSAAHRTRDAEPWNRTQ